MVTLIPWLRGKKEETRRKLVVLVSSAKVNHATRVTTLWLICFYCDVIYICMHLDPKVTFRSVAAAFFDASCIVAMDWSRGPHLGNPPFLTVTS